MRPSTRSIAREIRDREPIADMKVKATLPPIGGFAILALLSISAPISAQSPSLSMPGPENPTDRITPRFADCGDGTVADYRHGLQWEKKTAEPFLGINCEMKGCLDPHNVNNRYEWSNTGKAPDGGVFTDFLAKLNAQAGGVSTTEEIATGCFAAHCDWRLPTLPELRTLLIGPNAGPGQAKTCSGPPCVDPALRAVGGPTASSGYWTSSRMVAGARRNMWLANFFNGVVLTFGSESLDFYVRAVRTGSCTPPSQ